MAKQVKENNMKVILTWGKKEKDWIVKYPNGNGRILGNNLFTMIQEFANWKGKSLRETIEDGGYDPDSFKITIDLK